MFRVLLILPYPGMEKMVQNIYERDFPSPEFQVDIKAVSAENLQQLDLCSYDVVIGRGHTVKVLQEVQLSPSIIEIPLTGYDVLRAILEAAAMPSVRRIALFLSAGRNHDAGLLSSVSGRQVDIFVVQKLKDIEDSMIQAKATHYDVVVGGYSTNLCAARMYIPSVIIRTGEEAILQALTEAQNMMQAMTAELNRAKLYETVTQASKEGILYVNESGIISLINRRGLQLLPSPLDQVRGASLQDAYAPLCQIYQRAVQWKMPVLNEILEIDGKKLTFDFVPVLVENRFIGVVINFQSITHIQNMETQIRKRLSEKGLVARYTFNDIIHKSQVMDDVISLAKKYAAVSSNILIVGETGTGKELLAQGIHNMSDRNKKPFVAVNCAALPENLLESELFGYTEGSFTGSKKGGKIGLVEQAHQGTLFLDEISELPYNFQGEFLRVLQEKQVRRIGDDRVINVDVRIIAATNRNLHQLVKEGRFRQDLLYRLDILRVFLPPLCEREDDVALIFSYLLKKYCTQFGKDVGGCTEEARALLLQYPFEGNIRELSNIAERLCVMVEGDTIDVDLMRQALYPSDVRASIREAPTKSSTFSERDKILEALQKTGWKKSEAAHLLQMDRSTLWRKMKFYGIES